MQKFLTALVYLICNFDQSDICVLVHVFQDFQMDPGILAFRDSVSLDKANNIADEFFLANVEQLNLLDMPHLVNTALTKNKWFYP